MTQQTLTTTAYQDYLRRMGFPAPLDALEPTLPTLQALHRAHMLTVPFEDLSIHLGEPIILEEEALFEKIVRRRRGGFCYELNGLFAALLRHIGFQVTLLSAGVAHRDGGFGPEFDHMTLLVHQLSGADWLADVGFGDSFVLPLRFEEGLEQDGGEGRRYRLAQAGNYWMMQQFSGETWEAQYRFTLQPHVLSDYNEMCRHQATSPESHFVQNRVCSLATPEGRVTLSGGGRPGGDAGATPQSRGTANSGLKLITTVNGKREEQMLASEDIFREVLAERFGIVL